MANGPGNPMDYVALCATGATGTDWVAWQFLNGLHTAPATGVSGAAVTFTLPVTPGTYEVRFFKNNTLVLLATSVTVTVQ